MKTRTLIAGLVLAVLAVVLRLIYLQQFARLPVFDLPNGPDVFDYDSWAKAILSGQGLWQTPNIHGPLYPFFLALLDKLFSLQYFWIRLTQGLLGTAAFVGLFAILRRSGQTPLAWLVLVLAVIYPPLIYYQSELISETLLLPLFCLVLVLLDQADRMAERKGSVGPALAVFAAAGVTAGLAALTQPTAMVIVAGETVLLAAYHERGGRGQRGKRALPSVCFLAAAIAVVMPVCVYNATLPGGQFGIQSNGGLNFYIGNNPAATGIGYVRPGNAWDVLRARGERAAAERHCSPDRYYFDEIAAFIRQSPGAWLELLGKKCLYVFNFREIPSGADLGPLRHAGGFMHGTAWSSGILLALALFGLLVNLRRREFWRQYRHFLVLFFGYWLVLTLALVSGRHRMAMLPAFFVLAGLGLLDIRSLIRGPASRRAWMVALAAAVLAVLAVYLPTPAPIADEVPEAQMLLGDAYLQQNRPEQAAVCCDAALAVNADYAQAYCLKGVILMKQGKLSQARDYFVAAIKRNLPTCEAWVNLGLMAYSIGNRNLAEQCFAEAQRRWPHVPFQLYNYGYFLITIGRLDDAEKALRECLLLEPSSAEAINALGVLYLRRQQPGEAAGCFTRLLRMAPDNPGFLLNAGAAYLQNGQLDDAAECLRRLEQLQPDLPAARVLHQALDAARRR